MPRRYRFGSFELDPRSGELRGAGGLLRLQEQPLQVLLFLIERQGEVVTRDELRQRLWPDDTFVDFEHGLHAAVSRLRDALGDESERPTYVETLPRRGYRLLVPADALESTRTAAPLTPPPSDGTDRSALTPHPPPRGAARGARRLRALAAALVLVVAAGFVAWRIARPRPSAASPVRLAVLPFDNFTGDDDQQFFVDGLHEELTYRLGQIQPRQLAVIGRTSVLRYKGSPTTIATVARDLAVDYVLEGSVRRSAPRVRITAQLIRGSDQSHVWTESYERDWNDLLAIQKDIGARVAESLALELVPAYQAQMARDASVSAAAYEQYLRGLYLWNQRTRDPLAQLTRAIGRFNAALEQQPDYAPALVGLADAHNSLAFNAVAPIADHYAQARAAVGRALEKDDRLAAAHATLAWMQLNVDHDWAAAGRSFARALELDPGDARTRFRYAHLLAVRGDLSGASRETTVAAQVDPLSAEIPEFQAFIAWYDRRPDAALASMRRASDLNANAARFGAFAAYAAAARGDCATARDELTRLRGAADDVPRTTEAAYALARCATDPGVVERFREDLAARRLVYPEAMIHFGRGELDEFFRGLDAAIDAQSPEVIWIGIEPLFRPLHGDPRFQAALRRVHLEAP